MPQAYVDHHQMGNTNARLYIPPYAEPIRPDGDPLVWREMAWWGAHMGTQLEAAGKTGVVGAAIYSGWGHMGFHWITPFHNIAGMLTESASARLATPMFLHPDQLRGGPRNLPEYAPQTNMPSVWPGGWWRVRDIVEQQKIAAWATVDLAARNRETVLHNMYLKASRQVERGTTGPVKAYVLPAGQHDALTVRKLVNMLLASGVEVHEATAQLIVEGRVYGPGSFVVSMAQPKQALVRWMLGRTFYPDNSYTRERDGTPIRPYDMSTDTFGEFMGVRSEPVGEPVPVASLTKISGALVAPSTVAPSAPHGYVLDGRLNDSYRAVLLLLAKGIGVRRAQAASADGSVRQGDFLVAPGDVTAIAARAGVPFAALPAPVTSETTTLATPRIGLFQRYRGGNMDEGWTRLLFEQFDVPFTTVRDADLKAPGLPSKFDVIVLPADSLTAMTGEDPPAGARGGGGGEGGEGAVAADHAAGIPQRVRGRRREGAAGVCRGGRHAPDVRTGWRPADAALRAAAPQRRRRRIRQGVLVARVDAPCALRQRPPAGVRHAEGGAGVVHVRQPGVRGDVHRPQPGRGHPRDIRGPRPASERVAARRAGHRAQGSGCRRHAGQGSRGADRLPPAEPRPDARYVQDGVQRAAEEQVGCSLQPDSLGSLTDGTSYGRRGAVSGGRDSPA